MGAKLRFCERGGSNAELKRSRGAEKTASRRGPGGVAFHKNLTQKKGSYKMKTRKKLVSILCAAALLVSALPAASAVSAEPLSEYAGKTIPVQVVEETENGLTSRIINVAIPEGTSPKGKDALVCAAALGRGTAATRSITGTLYDITLGGEEQKVGGGTPKGVLFSAIDEVAILFSVESLSPARTWLQFQLRSSTKPGSVTEWKRVQPYTQAWEVVFVTNEFRTLYNYSNGINVYGKTLSNDTAVLSHISVYGVVN